jgi:outer membrane lipoprotein-sorting protein
LLLLAPILLASTDNWSSIQEAARKVTSVQADFIQTKHLKMLARPITAEGKLYYRKPGELRWEYTGPIKSVLIKNKRGISRMTWRDGAYRADAEAKLKPVQLVLEQMELWLQGDYVQSTLFTATLEAGPSPKIKLVPKNKSLGSLITAVYVFLAEQPGAVDSIEIWENQDSVTRIKLKNVKLNGTFPAKVFEPPA